MDYIYFRERYVTSQLLLLEAFRTIAEFEIPLFYTYTYDCDTHTNCAI